MYDALLKETEQVGKEAKKPKALKLGAQSLKDIKVTSVKEPKKVKETIEEGENLAIMFSDLNPEAQMEVLQYMGISDPEEANWGVVALAYLSKPEPELEGPDVSGPPNAGPMESKKEPKDTEEEAARRRANQHEEEKKNKDAIKPAA